MLFLQQLSRHRLIVRHLAAAKPTGALVETRQKGALAVVKGEVERERVCVRERDRQRERGCERERDAEREGEKEKDRYKISRRQELVRKV